VKRHHGQPAAGPQKALAGREATVKLAQLIVYVDSQSLESLCRRIDATRPAPDDPAHDIGELAGPRNPRHGALRNNCARDRSGTAFFAVGKYQIGQRFF